MKEINILNYIYRRYTKRIVDIFLSVCGLFISAIPMLLISIAIKLDSPGPIIFRQKRLGKNQQIFTIYKFRTMCEHAYEIGGIVTRADDSRITRVGKILRRSSLDELPQMFNILKGDMSIIGPRPILPCEFEKYKSNSIFCQRYNVLPGMFCTVDVKYRSSSNRVQQFKMDVNYVKRMCFLLDIYTFFQIISPVLKGKNVYKKEINRFQERR